MFRCQLIMQDLVHSTAHFICNGSGRHFCRRGLLLLYYEFHRRENCTREFGSFFVAPFASTNPCRLFLLITYSVVPLHIQSPPSRKAGTSEILQSRMYSSPLCFNNAAKETQTEKKERLLADSRNENCSQGKHKVERILKSMVVE